MDSAVIFDVDGVLLDLTPAEEDGFFLAFQRRYGLTGLSRDWNSYKVRNDEHIIAEILDTHGLPASDAPRVVADYLAIMADGIADGSRRPAIIPGAAELLASLEGRRIGIATANLLSAAKLRLTVHDLWEPVQNYAFGSEGSGHKRETLARAIAALDLPPGRIVYVGDNLNDVDAGLANNVHFIGFSTDAARRGQLAAAGAQHLADDHAATAALIARLLA